MDNFHSRQALQSELLPGEALLWVGQPHRSVIFHKEDTFLIPFSLMWGGFFIFWEFMASTTGNWLFILWGVPFVLAGQYLIWGRFVYTWWKKGRVFYGVTDKRVIVLDRAWGRRANVAYIDQLSTIQKDMRSDGIGTLRFGYPAPTARKGSFASFESFDAVKTSGVPTFVDVENAASVYLVVSEAKEKPRGSRAASLAPPHA
jgi:hypothetical protein